MTYTIFFLVLRVFLRPTYHRVNFDKCSLDHMYSNLELLDVKVCELVPSSWPIQEVHTNLYL